MKVGLVGDVHLDSAFALFAPELARRRRHGIEAAFRRALNEAANAPVDAVFIAGDLYEHDRVAPNTGEFLRGLFAEVAPLPIFVAPGNHDWHGPESLYARLEWPPNVRIFTEDRLEPLELEVGLTLWGAAHRAPANTDGFLDGFRTQRGGVNVALLHGSEQAAFAFQAEGKIPHAPFSAGQIDGCGLTHVFCGHFHTPVDHARYTYPGNPEPLTFGEPSSPIRGLVIATIAADGTIARERVRVAETTVTEVVVDVSGCASGDDVRQEAKTRLKGLSGCVRVTVQGGLEPQVDVRLDDLSRDAPWLDAVVVRPGALSVAYDLEAIKAESTVRGEFVNDVLDSEHSDDVQRRVVVTGLRALEGRTDLEVV